MNYFFESQEYKTLKAEYERTCFKLIGKYCINTGDKIIEKSSSEINEYFKNKKITIEIVEQQTTKKGTTITNTKEMTKNFYQIWSEDPEMKEYMELVFNCDLSKVLPSQYNLFEGFKHFDKIKPKTKINLELVFEHMRSLVNYNEIHFNYVLNWLAQLVQQPHILPHTTLIFISDEGVGKDLFSKFISNVINNKYTHNTEKLDNICGKFNSILGGKLLITINETNPVESRERIENIKFLITAEEITIEGKHKDPIKAPNFCRFIFFSNRLFAFPVENGSRRPVIFKSSDKYLPINFGIEENKKYFSNLAENIYKNVEYQKAFLEFLMKRDISKFNPKDIVKSELHNELEETSLSPIVGFLADIVRSNEKDFKMTTKETREHFNNYMKEQNLKYEITPTKFIVEMTSIYNIKKVKNSNEYFVFEIEKLKELLTKKYKFNFDEVDEKDEIKEKYNPLDGELQNDILREENEKLKNKIKELEAQLALLQKPEIKQVVEVENKITNDDIDELEKELNNILNIKPKEEERFYLLVPYENKENIKKNGGLYDKDKKQWYVLKNNPKFKYLTFYYSNKNYKKTKKGLELVAFCKVTMLEDNIFQKECEKQLGIVEDNKKDEIEGTNIYVPYEYKNEAKKDGCKCKKVEEIDEDGNKSTHYVWYVLESNPKYNYCVEFYNQYNFTDSFYGTKMNIYGREIIDKYNKK